MPEPAVVQVMNGFRRDLLNREATQQARMVAQWRQVERGLIEQVERFTERVAQDGLTAGQIRSRQFQLDRYAELLRQARTELNKYVEVVTPQITAEQRVYAARGIQQASAGIRVAVAGARITFDVLPVMAIENLVGLAGDGSPLRNLLQSSYGAGAQGMLDTLIQSVATGRNPKVTARMMVREGLSQSLSRMMLTARTEQLRVFRESSRQQYRNSGVVEGYRRLATKSSRTCVACLIADGELLELDEVLATHPGCRCTSVPIVTGFAPVQWEKGADWLQKQPEHVQRKIMGPGRFQGWKDGAFSLGDMVTKRSNSTWGDSLQPSSLRDLQAGNAKPYTVRLLDPARPIAPLLDRVLAENRG
jgi:SPP1 gp7 family putative phage head morphogenesis protein